MLKKIHIPQFRNRSLRFLPPEKTILPHTKQGVEEWTAGRVASVCLGVHLSSPQKLFGSLGKFPNLTTRAHGRLGRANLRASAVVPTCTSLRVQSRMVVDLCRSIGCNPLRTSCPPVPKSQNMTRPAREVCLGAKDGSLSARSLGALHGVCGSQSVLPISQKCLKCFETSLMFTFHFSAAVGLAHLRDGIGRSKHRLVLWLSNAFLNNIVIVNLI